MILKHLDPNAMLVNINFNYFISRLIFYIKKHANEEDLTVAQFILLESCEIFAIIAYLIYIEIIELKFCQLDYHLKKTITKRGQLDYDLLFAIEDNDDQDDELNYYIRKESLVNNNNEIRKGSIIFNNNNNKGIEMTNKEEYFNSTN